MGQTQKGALVSNVEKSGINFVYVVLFGVGDSPLDIMCHVLTSSSLAEKKGVHVKYVRSNWQNDVLCINQVPAG